MSFIVPAVLPTSRKELDEKLVLFAELPGISRVQIDVVDGKFAAPASWPYVAPEGFQEMLQKGEMLPHLHKIDYEIDLMCLNVEQAAEDWLALGATRLTIHAESALDLGLLFAKLRERFGCGILGCDVVSFGLALNIESDLALIESYIEQVEYVQFMGIATIGKQGQPFDRRVLEKIRIFHLRHPHMPIQVDGGVSLTSASELLASGVTSLIVGSVLVRATDPVAIVEKFEHLRLANSSVRYT